MVGGRWWVVAQEPELLEIHIHIVNSATLSSNVPSLVLRGQHGRCMSGTMPYDSSFRGLKVWQQSMTLVEEIYKATSSFPGHEQFGLTSQIRRASVSIPSNIAEGKRRK